MFCNLVSPPHTRMGVAWIEGSWGMKTCLYGRCRQAQKITTALNSVILLLWPCDEKTSALRLASDASITQPRHILAQPDCHVYPITRMNSDKMLSCQHQTALRPALPVHPHPLLLPLGVRLGVPPVRAEVHLGSRPNS